MPPFKMPDGSFQNAATYAAARVIYDAAHRAPVVAPVAPVAVPVVVTITPTLTPVADFPNRSRVRFGIGEHINLGFTTNPAGRTAASFGGLTWALTRGSATLTNAPGNTGTGTLICGENAGQVSLELRTATPPVAVKATKQLAVIAPNDVVFVRAPGTGTFHTQGVRSAGFKAITYLRPADVSFSYLEFREGGASYEGTGIFKRSEATLAELATSYDTIHPILADWGPVNGGDSAVNGSLVSGRDTVSTSIVAAGVGTFDWSIPQIVRVIGGRNELFVKSLVHHVDVDAAGALTISKGGVVVPHNLNDPTSTY